MATPFNLNARINLQGPDVRPFINKLRKGLGQINAKIDVKVSKGANQSLKTLRSNLKGVQTSLIAINKLSASTNANFVAMGRAFNSLAANVNKAAANTKAYVTNINNAAKAQSKLTRQTKSTSAGVDTAASRMKEFGRVSGEAIRKFAGFRIAQTLVFGMTQALRNAVGEAIKFERELIKVSQVTGLSVKGLSGLTTEISRLSTEFGVSSAELLGATITLEQAGLKSKAALDALAKSSLAPTFKDIQSTTEGAIAAMQQFSLAGEDLESVLGSINSVSKKFAVESSDIVGAIKRAGGVFAAAAGEPRDAAEAKSNLNEFIALFTSVRATTRESAESIATGLRTIFSRLQRGDTISSLEALGANLIDLEGKFVGPYRAVGELNKVLNDLPSNDPRFAKIVEELGGFRQVSKAIPLIKQFATAQEALKTAQSGQDSLSEDAEIALQSLAVQMSKTKEEFLLLIREVTQTGTFKGIASVILTIADTFVTLARTIKPILPLLAAFAAFKIGQAGIQFFSGFKQGLSGIGPGSPGTAGGAASGSQKQAKAAQTSAATNKAILALTSGLSANTNAVINNTAALSRMAAGGGAGLLATRGGGSRGVGPLGAAGRSYPTGSQSYLPGARSYLPGARSYLPGASSKLPTGPGFAQRNFPSFSQFGGSASKGFKGTPGAGLGAGIGLALAAPIAANAIGDETATNAGIGGALTGAVAGGLIGGSLGGPAGAAIGAVAGAALGFSNAFKDAADRIRSVEIGDALTELEKAIKAFQIDDNVNNSNDLKKKFDNINKLGNEEVEKERLKNGKFIRSYSSVVADRQTPEAIKRNQDIDDKETKSRSKVAKAAFDPIISEYERRVAEFGIKNIDKIFDDSFSKDLVSNAFGQQNETFIGATGSNARTGRVSSRNGKQLFNKLSEEEIASQRKTTGDATLKADLAKRNKAQDEINEFNSRMKTLTKTVSLFGARIDLVSQIAEKVSNSGQQFTNQINLISKGVGSTTVSGPKLKEDLRFSSQKDINAQLQGLSDAGGGSIANEFNQVLKDTKKLQSIAPQLLAAISAESGIKGDSFGVAFEKLTSGNGKFADAFSGIGDNITSSFKIQLDDTFKGRQADAGTKALDVSFTQEEGPALIKKATAPLVKAMTEAGNAIQSTSDTSVNAFRSNALLIANKLLEIGRIEDQIISSTASRSAKLRQLSGAGPDSPQKQIKTTFERIKRATDAAGIRGQSPGAVGSGIRALRARQLNLSSQLDGTNKTDQQQKLVQALVDNSTKLKEAENALGLLADRTQDLAAIEAKIQQIDERKSLSDNAKLGIQDRLLLAQSSVAEARNLQTGLSGAAKFRTGGVLTQKEREAGAANIFREFEAARGVKSETVEKQINKVNNQNIGRGPVNLGGTPQQLAKLRKQLQTGGPPSKARTALVGQFAVISNQQIQVLKVQRTLALDQAKRLGAATNALFNTQNTLLHKMLSRVERLHDVRSSRGPGGVLGGAVSGFTSGGKIGGAFQQRSKDNRMASVVGGGPIALQGGEFIINTSATARNRDLLESINDGENVRGFASGGSTKGSRGSTIKRTSSTRQGDGGSAAANKLASALGEAATRLETVAAMFSEGFKIEVAVAPMQVNVIHNGAEVFAAMTPAVQKIATDTVNNALMKNFNSISGEPADGITPANGN